MTTPTPMKLNPSQQGRTPSAMPGAPTPRTMAAASPPVSTPFSQLPAAFSPAGHGPRSSPQHFKKSPANSSTLMGYPSNAPVSYDSPSAAAALNILGIADLDLDVNATPGTLMMNTLQQGADEDDKVRKLANVMEILQPFKGRVSEAGLERLASRTGLDMFWEDSTTNGAATRTLIIAGNALSLDIVCANNIVLAVMLSFPGAASIVEKHSEKANKILLRNLKLRPGQSPLTKTLDDFAANLELLAALDKLCVIPVLNCHEAIAGVYESLDKLFRSDVNKLLAADPTQTQDAAEMAAACTHHGRPLMHARGRIGLSLAYWRERWMVAPHTRPTTRLAEAKEPTYSLLIGCAKLDNRVTSQTLSYPSVRVSERWIADNIETLDLNGSMLDWLEPRITVIPNPDAEAKDNQTPEEIIMAGGKFPEVIFTATFDPPLTVPIHEWEMLRNMVEDPDPEFINHVTYDSLMFPYPLGEWDEPAEPRHLSSIKSYPAFSRIGGRTLVKQNHSIYINKRIYGYTLTELPFSHPKQLIAMLPILRQYAMLSTLLDVSFGNRPEQSPPPPTMTTNPPTKRRQPPQPNLVVVTDRTKKSNASTTTGDKSTTTVAAAMTAAQTKKLKLTDDFDSFMDAEDKDSKDNVTNSDSNRTAFSWAHNSDQRILGPSVPPPLSGVPVLATTALPNPTEDEAGEGEDGKPMGVDISLHLHPTPSLKINFPVPLAEGRGSFSADMLVEVRQDGYIVVEGQNLVEPDGVEHRRIESGLQKLCDLGQWINWVRGEFGGGGA